MESNNIEKIRPQILELLKGYNVTAIENVLSDVLMIVKFNSRFDS